MIVADTSGLLALFNSAEPAHREVVAALAEERDALVVSPFVVAELDYLIATRVGQAEALNVVKELAGGAYDLAAIDTDDLEVVSEVMSRYREHGIGVADASLVLLADRYATRRVLTLDRRHFDVLRSLGGEAFEIVP